MTIRANRSGSVPRRAVRHTLRSDHAEVREEIVAWIDARGISPSAPLAADDLVRLAREAVAAFALDASIVAELSVHTIHYYRRKDIIDPAEGRTASSRYARRHLLQILGARLAGHLGLVTLAEARAHVRDASEDRLLTFLAARISDARAKAMLRGMDATGAEAPRPLPGRATVASPAEMIALPGGAWCVLPSSHRAHRSRAAAEELGRALVASLHPTSR